MTCKCGHPEDDHEPCMVIPYGALHHEIGLDEPPFWIGDCRVLVEQFRLCDCMRYEEAT